MFVRHPSPGRCPPLSQRLPRNTSRAHILDVCIHTLTEKKNPKLLSVSHCTNRQPFHILHFRLELILAESSLEPALPLFFALLRKKIRSVCIGGSGASTVQFDRCWWVDMLRWRRRPARCSVCLLWWKVPSVGISLAELSHAGASTKAVEAILFA